MGHSAATLLSSQAGPGAEEPRPTLHTLDTPKGSRMLWGQAPAHGSYRTGVPAGPVGLFNTGRVCGDASQQEI